MNCLVTMETDQHCFTANGCPGHIMLENRLGWSGTQSATVQSSLSQPTCKGT